jgi:integrase
VATIIRKPGNTRKPWTVRYWHEGRQRERSFRIKREAQDFVANFEHSRREGTYIDPRAGSQRFRDYAARWLKMHTGAPSTLAAYRSALECHLYPAIGDTPLRNITRERLRDLLLVDLPSKGLGYHAVAKCRLVLSAVLDEAVRERKVTANECKGIRLPARPNGPRIEVPSPERIDKLTAAMFRFRPVVGLMAGCGLRIGEALAVRFENIGDGVLRVTEQRLPDGSYGPLKHRKAGDYRDVPLPSWVAQELGQVAQELGQGQGYVFGPEANHDTVSRVFRQARNDAGLPEDFTPHSLRHVFASVALSNGVPLTDVSRFLGHQNIQVTYGQYSHLIPTSVGAARAVLDAWHKG